MTILETFINTPQRWAELQLALNRALNTWENSPPWITEMVDAIERMGEAPDLSQQIAVLNDCGWLVTKQDGCVLNVRKDDSVHPIAEADVIAELKYRFGWALSFTTDPFVAQFTTFTVHFKP